MNEEFEKEFAKLSEKDKREVNNLIRFMQEKKYHDKQYEELLNQYIELSRDYDYLQSKIDKVIDKINQYGLIVGYYDSNYDKCDDTYSHEIKDELLDILEEDK